MKTFVLLLFSLLLLKTHESTKLPAENAINAIIGEAGYLHIFGQLPDSSVDESLRIRTHLKFVLDLLKAKNPKSLTPLQQQNRQENLCHLEAYLKQGDFPSNYDYPNQRKPCFIDRDGRICAVGYLVEQSEGREVAQQINESFQYEKIMDMDSEVLDAWIEQSGLSKRECAMIQPTYRRQFEAEQRTIIRSSYVMTGLNTGLGVVQGLQLSNQNRRKLWPIIGMVSGGFQCLGSIANRTPQIDRDYFAFWYPESIELQQRAYTANTVNIFVGGAAFLLSTANLILPLNKKNRPLSYQVYHQPGRAGNSEMGLGVRLRF